MRFADACPRIVRPTSSQCGAKRRLSATSAYRRCGASSGQGCPPADWRITRQGVRLASAAGPTATSARLPPPSARRPHSPNRRYAAPVAESPRRALAVALRAGRQRRAVLQRPTFPWFRPRAASQRFQAAPSSRICWYTCRNKCSETTFWNSTSFMYLANSSSFCSIRSMNSPSKALTKT